MSPISPIYRAREVTRYTCIRGFAGRKVIKSGVFDATTLSPISLAAPAQYVTVWGAGGTTQYMVPIGSFLTQSTTDPTKVKVYAGLGTNANDQQTVTITGTPTGGSFTLTFNGQTTAAIAYNAAASAVVTALTALSNIGVGNVTATGGALPGSAVVVSFAGLLGNLPQNVMTASGAGLTGGSSPAVTVTHTTPGTTAEKIIGVFDGPDHDFFGNASVAYDEPIPIYFHSVSFDISKLQNWLTYGAAAQTALPNCTFY